MDDHLANSSQSSEAVEMVRQKLRQIYGAEPSAALESKEANQPGVHHSKHQRFMHELSHSGKSLADIQTQWHNYYQNLPDNEKHEVWQEFYKLHNPAQEPRQEPKVEFSQPVFNEPKHSQAPKNVSELKRQLLSNVKRGARPQKQHLKSLMFGLACGLVVIVVVLFSFFNERFIAPFITPSKDVSNTPLIIDPNSTTAGPNPEIIIPKINVEIPVVYTAKTINEQEIENNLEDGVVHYPTTSNPGEIGNGAIFGHSSNNIFNKGKYKFAFVLLKRLENGDTFTLQKDSKRYVYKVFDKKIVKPDEVSVLGPIPGHTATFTLITCDPPGTSINRLVVVGDQISPDPAKNTASTAQLPDHTPKILPSNSPTLWSRLWGWLTR